MRIIGGALVACLIGCPQLVVAAETSRHAMAEELIELLGIDKQMTEHMARMREMQKARWERMEQAQPSSPPASDAETGGEQMMDMIAEAMSWVSLKEEYVTMYAATFTEDELRGAIEFYRSPVGQKWLEKTPELTKRTMEIHPAVSVAAIFVGANLMGGIGVVLALPMTGIIQAIISESRKRHDVILDDAGGEPEPLLET